VCISRQSSFHFAFQTIILPADAEEEAWNFNYSTILRSAALGDNIIECKNCCYVVVLWQIMYDEIAPQQK
jgi:hypothetical protein